MSSPTPARNNWNCYASDELFSWTAAVALPGALTHLGDWQDVVLTAGERHGVLRVERVAPLGYERARDGFVGDVIRAHPDLLPAQGDWYPAGFLLGRWLDLVTASRLAYATGDGIEVDWFTDMADVAARAGVARCASTPPVTLYTDGGADLDGAPAVAVHIAVTSDIWFPWNPPGTRAEAGPIDNRPLARHNGSRLNAFLAEVRAATTAAGGTWTPPRPPAPWEFDDDGIRLN